MGKNRNKRFNKKHNQNSYNGHGKQLRNNQLSAPDLTPTELRERLGPKLLSELIKKHQRQGIEYSVKYIRYLFNPHEKEKLHFFGQNPSEANIARYQANIDAQQFYCDKNNAPFLIAMGSSVLKEKFGENYEYYGIPRSYKSRDIPQGKPGRNQEKYVFLHDDDFLEALRKAPKIPFGDWESAGNNKNSDASAIKSRKYIFNVNGQILIGEVIVEKTRMGHIIPNARSDIKFSVYYRGQEDGKFTVERWDYEPAAQHLNKCDSQGNYFINGVKCPKTQFSHRHVYTLQQRLAFTQNFSADIYPTPINENRSASEEELHYESFDAMYDSFMEELCIEDKLQLSYSRINGMYKPREFGELYCPEYTYHYDAATGKKVVEVKPAERDITEVIDRKRQALTEEVSVVESQDTVPQDDATEVAGQQKTQSSQEAATSANETKTQGGQVQ